MSPQSPCPSDLQDVVAFGNRISSHVTMRKASSRNKTRLSSLSTPVRGHGNIQHMAVDNSGVDPSDTEGDNPVWQGLQNHWHWKPVACVCKFSDESLHFFLKSSFGCIPTVLCLSHKNIPFAGHIPVSGQKGYFSFSYIVLICRIYIGTSFITGSICPIRTVDT